VHDPEISLAEQFLSNLERELNALAIQPRRPNRYPFDFIALEIINKSFALARSCLCLIRNGFPDEAYGLSRSIIECSIILRFLTQDPAHQADRTKLFYIVEITDKKSWLEFARAHITDPALVAELEKYAAEIRLEERYSNLPNAGGHWSSLRGFTWHVTKQEHPLDQEANPEKLRKKAYAVDYGYSSQYVHCSQVALGGYLPKFGILHSAFEVSQAAAPKQIPGDRVFWIIGLYLHATVRYTLFGMAMDRAEPFGRIIFEYLKGLQQVDSPSEGPGT
jgi:hypothetical protein